MLFIEKMDREGQQKTLDKAEEITKNVSQTFRDI